MERDLGTVLAESSEHTNLQVDGIDDLVMIEGGGLQGSVDFGNVETGTITPLTKSCLKLWADLARMTLSLGCRSDIRNAELRSPT